MVLTLREPQVNRTETGAREGVAGKFIDAVQSPVIRVTVQIHIGTDCYVLRSAAMQDPQRGRDQSSRTDPATTFPPLARRYGRSRTPVKVNRCRWSSNKRDRSALPLSGFDGCCACVKSLPLSWKRVTLRRRSARELSGLLGRSECKALPCEQRVTSYEQKYLVIEHPLASANQSLAFSVGVVSQTESWGEVIRVAINAGLQ